MMVFLGHGNGIMCVSVLILTGVALILETCLHSGAWARGMVERWVWTSAVRHAFLWGTLGEAECMRG